MSLLKSWKAGFNEVTTDKRKQWIHKFDSSDYDLIGNHLAGFR